MLNPSGLKSLVLVKFTTTNWRTWREFCCASISPSTTNCCFLLISMQLHCNEVVWKEKIKIVCNALHTILSSSSNLKWIWMFYFPESFQCYFNLVASKVVPLGRYAHAHTSEDGTHRIPAAWSYCHLFFKLGQLWICRNGISRPD